MVNLNEAFFKEVRTRFDHPNLTIVAERVVDGVPRIHVRHHSFNTDFDVIPAIDWPSRYHAQIVRHTQ